MNILLFGKNGQLGWELQRPLSLLGKLTAPTSKELDIKNLTELRNTINALKPNIIINASAYTAVDRAEAEPEIAMQVNAHAPAMMAECAKHLNAVFVHYSTDYVFDGSKNTPYTEEDLTHPLNVYGESKLKGEQAISQIGGAFVILRTSWVYSLRGDNFVTRVLEWARQKETLQVVTDQIGSPTWVNPLAEATTSMIKQSMPDSQSYFLERSGIYHLGGSGEVSRYDFAQLILRFDPHPQQQRVKRIEPALTADFPTSARRPLATPLNCLYFDRTFGISLTGWEESLRLALNGKDT